MEVEEEGMAEKGSVISKFKILYDEKGKPLNGVSSLILNSCLISFSVLFRGEWQNDDRRMVVPTFYHILMIFT